MDQEENFTNEQIDASNLPDFQRVALSPVADAYRPWAVVTQTGVGLVLSLAALVFTYLSFLPFEPPWWLPLPFLAMAVAGGVYAVLDAKTRAWALREHDLIYRHGVIWRKTVIVPFARIQHVEAVHGPLERYLDLMRVKCFTAGGMSADLTVKGLDRASARRVRQYLLEQISETAGAADESPESAAAGTDVAERASADD